MVLLITGEGSKRKRVLHLLISSLVALVVGCQSSLPTNQVEDKVSPVATALPPPAIVKPPPAETKPPPIPSIELIKLTAAHEMAAVNAGGHYRYRFQERTPQGMEIRDVVETSSWLISRAICWNGVPLSPAQKKQEDERLQALLANPVQGQELQKKQSENEARIRRMIEAVPDAFVYEYTGFEKDASGHELAHLRFRPNLKFSPRSWELRTFEGMAGTVLIDVAAARVVRIEARLFRDVNFGWGVLGRVYQGGTFLLEQQGQGSNRWALTRLALNYTNRRLLTSTHVDSITQATDFHYVPTDLTFAMAVTALLDSNQVMIVQEETAAPH